MAGLAIPIDRIKSNAMMKSVAQDFLELDLRQLAAGQRRLVVTARAIFGQGGVTGREFARVEKSFVRLAVDKR